LMISRSASLENPGFSLEICNLLNPQFIEPASYDPLV
jgi:hypothetical protein